MFKFKVGIFLSCLKDFRNIKTDELRKKKVNADMIMIDV